MYIKTCLTVLRIAEDERKHAVFLCVITTVDPYFLNFMVRKPAIHGHYKAEEEKAWYNNYKDFT